MTGLPAPRSVVGSVIEETDVLEEEVKPKASQIADVEKPQKKKQPVKITIPALPVSGLFSYSVLHIHVCVIISSYSYIVMVDL